MSTDLQIVSMMMSFVLLFPYNSARLRPPFSLSPSERSALYLAVIFSPWLRMCPLTFFVVSSPQHRANDSCYFVGNYGRPHSTLFWESGDPTPPHPVPPHPTSPTPPDPAFAFNVMAFLINVVAFPIYGMAPGLTVAPGHGQVFLGTKKVALALGGPVWALRVTVLALAPLGHGLAPLPPGLAPCP